MVGGKPEYLVKWTDYPAEEMTWEPEHHLPDAAISLFQNTLPPQQEWTAEARERIAIVLEKGLKTHKETDETLNLSHTVLRHLFPRLPLEQGSKAFQATEADLAAAGLAQYIEQIVTVNGGKRKFDFPVFIKPLLGNAPVFRTADGKRSQPRKVEKVKISFTKNC